MLLGCLGVTAEEERIYRFLLKGGKGTVEEIRQALGLAGPDVRSTLERLVGLGLVHTRGGGVTAVDPAIGVERLVEDVMAGLRARMQQADAARAAISELGQEFRRGEGVRAAPAPDIEHVTGRQEVWDRLDELTFFAYREVMAIHPGAPWRPWNIEAARPLDMRCLRRGLTYRLIVVREALQDPLTRAYLEELRSAGAQVRCVEEPVQRMAVYDRSRAVVPLDPEEKRRGAVVVRQPGLVAGFVDLFEQTWQSAADPATVDGGEECPLPELDRQVLEALVRADKDEVAARELGVSLRTFQRYVAHLMARLDAGSRFQAAVRAKERGWL
ncbi:helix-turn-helix transcriptional regulator [Streptomyces klenkii]|uniref:Helix-turn-helix transcriptional regulator n=1 Tax=Streptomyces klenkii TaxID=1420899 RepID=A0A3B0BPT1_9ACTN|nr:helix-turn-helix domain-containing protein [Streptomyces klenkii]RKN74591.1 helix-turn-helix transcriptional regulator [Streptomyces klenkii]